MRKTLLFVSLALGFAFDLLFWKQAPGISFFLFTVLCLAAGYVLLKKYQFQPAKASLALFIPVLFFALMTTIRREPFTALLSTALTLVSMALAAATYRSGAWLTFSLADYLTTAFTFVGRVLAFAFLSAPEPAPAAPAPIRRDPWPYLRGAALAAPVLLLFGALFSSADLVFAARAQALLASLNLDNLGETLIRAALILIVAYLLAGVFNHAASYSHEARATGKVHALPAPLLGFTEAAIVLGSVLLLFAAFTAIQFQYFFSGSSNISAAGFTYSEYARRGFGELLAVAVFSLALLQILAAHTRRGTPRQSRAFSALSCALVALVLIILFSAFQRLSLYEAAYGFSRLRATAHVFMLWLAALLIATAVLQAVSRPRAFWLAALLALFGFGAALGLLNVDAFIVCQNVQRAQAGSPMDVPYLVSLSADAVPALTRMFTDASLDASVREGVGAALACRALPKPAVPERVRSWQSFHFADDAARRALQQLEPDLAGYSLASGTDLPRVLAPSGAQYDCISVD